MGKIRYQLFTVPKRSPVVNYRTDFSQIHLPIAIVSSLAYTLDKDLYWDKIHKDTAEQVVSRGILYLLIFAQYATLRYPSDDRLGLMIRWSYGYRYLLAPEDYKPDMENQELSTNKTTSSSNNGIRRKHAALPR